MWGVLVIKFLEALIGPCCSFVSLPSYRTRQAQACLCSLVLPEPLSMKGHPCVVNVGAFAGIV